MIPSGLQDGHLVPGIHNLQSVGSSPIRRVGVWQVQPRDLTYQVEGAGQTSSKLNARYLLPAMLRQEVTQKPLVPQTYLNSNGLKVGQTHQSTIQDYAPNILRQQPTMRAGAPDVMQSFESFATSPSQNGYKRQGESFINAGLMTLDPRGRI